MVKKQTPRSISLALYSILFIGITHCGYSQSPVGKGQAGKPLDLFLNLDFYDMMYTKPPFCKGVEDRDGHYTQQELESMLGKAAKAGFSTVNFRVAVCGKVAYHSKIKSWADDQPEMARTLQHYDPLKVTIDFCKANGMECYVWMTPFDDSAKVEGHAKRGRGFMQSLFSWLNPQFQLLSPEGDDPVWGVYSFGHPEVVQYWLAQIDEVLTYKPDGVFLSDRTHSNMNVRQIEYGFNGPVIERYKKLHGGDPREPEHYDLKKFSSVQGDFYTEFLRQASARVRNAGARLMVKVSWQQKDEKIASRLTALDKSFFQWDKWIDEKIIDELVIGGDAATGKGEEFVLGYYDMKADISRPDYFKKKPHNVKIYRWLTLFDWHWPKKEGLVREPMSGASFFDGEAITKMMGKVSESGADGLLIHEAMPIEMLDQWDVYRSFSDKFEKK